VTRRRAALLAVGTLIAIPLVYLAVSWLRFPSDRTPEGAYYRIVTCVNSGRPQACFPYIETEAQHASFTIRTYRKQARDRVLRSYPEPEKSRLAESYAMDALAPDGSDVFAHYATEWGFIDRLRKDLSGVKNVEIRGERATVETVKGTRYPFRRRENGIWGLTIFTAPLVAEAEKAARDAALIDKAGDDYDRVRGK
jgi:hypothetical protein